MPPKKSKVKKGKAGKAGHGSAPQPSEDGSSILKTVAAVAVVVAIAVATVLKSGTPPSAPTSPVDAPPSPPPPLPETVDVITPKEARTCGVSKLLSSREVPGLHVLCLVERETYTLVSAWAGATGSQPSSQFAIHRPPTPGAPPKPAVLADKLGLLPRKPPYQPAGLFTCAEGNRVEKVGTAALCLFEGGQFIWPPARVGSKRSVALPDGRSATIKTLSVEPIVLEVDNFLSASEAAHIREAAEPHLKKSGVALKDADRGKAAKEWRTSSQYFLSTAGDPVLEALDARVQALTRIPITHAEYIQVLRYNKMEHYSAHHDFFDPAAYASNPQMLADVEHGAKNRLATVFFYLSNVTAGGETNFPRAGGLPQPHDFFDCSKGLSVFPQLGRVSVGGVSEASQVRVALVDMPTAPNAYQLHIFGCR